MSSQPLVSVCIPCYNGARFIGRTIESVLRQSFTHFELVVVDDKSTDETVSIIQRFADPRLRLVCNPVNLGMGRNWNRVLSMGMGKYVKLLCEDDLLHPSCLARQVAALEDPNLSGVVLAICNRNVINSRDEVVLGPKRFLAGGIVHGRDLLRKSIRSGSNIIGEPAVGLFRREALTRNEICDPENPYLSDLCLWRELLRQGDAFVDPEALASFRISSSAATTGIGLGQAAYFRQFAKELRNVPSYRLTRFDLLCAYTLSFQWCLLRNAFIRLRSERHPRRSKSGLIPNKHLVSKPTHANCS